MDKTELIETIEKLEHDRINLLPANMFLDEMESWFSTPFTTVEKGLVNDYMTDFMKYQEDKSYSELKEFIAKYKGMRKIIICPFTHQEVEAEVQSDGTWLCLHD